MCCFGESCQLYPLPIDALDWSTCPVECQRRKPCHLGYCCWATIEPLLSRFKVHVLQCGYCSKGEEKVGRKELTFQQWNATCHMTRLVFILLLLFACTNKRLALIHIAHFNSIKPTMSNQVVPGSNLFITLLSRHCFRHSKQCHSTTIHFITPFTPILALYPL